MNDTKSVSFFELVVKRCSRAYGSSPCAAAIGVTGEYKCYNTTKTCQDPANYLGAEEVVLRFVEPTADLPIGFDAYPCVTKIQIRPQKLQPGEAMAVRESATIGCGNFVDNDSKLDKYLSSRNFNPYERGTFWGKFFARFGNLQGSEIRIGNGYIGQNVADMERRYYVLDAVSGPDSNGRVSFTAKDVLKLIDEEKALAPAPSAGVISADITDVATSLVLVPAGIGNLKYPANGIASIGDEKVTYTRSGDTVTLTARGLSGSKQGEHKEGETFQIALIYSPQSAADIINHLLINYTEIPSDYLDLAVWQNEIDTYVGQDYAAEIMQPTPVKKLINELIVEAGLIFGADLKSKKIIIKALRSFVPVMSLNDDNFIAGSITSTTLYDKRISDVWVYFGKKNPLEKEDEKKNYAAIYAGISANVVAALEDAPPVVKEVFSRWITIQNQGAVVNAAASTLARYETAPRQVGFKLHPTYDLKEGQVVSLRSRIFEDSQGSLAPESQFQILQIVREQTEIQILAEEIKFAQLNPGTERIIEITENVFNVNLRTLHDLLYEPAVAGDTVKLIIHRGVIIGSNSIFLPALNIGEWDFGVVIEIRSFGPAGYSRIQGAGGNSSSEIGFYKRGGDAIYTRHPVEIYDDHQIWSGGGGGGLTYVVGSVWGGGGYVSGTGGAGSIPGVPGATTERAGTPGNSYQASGGVPGENGQNSSSVGGSSGGLAGSAIDGMSFVTINDPLDIRGYTIN